VEPIPVLNPRPEVAALWQPLQEAVAAVMRSGRLYGGPNVTAFAAEAATWLGARHAVAAASGGEALRIALEAAGIGPGAGWPVGE
jgi:dTDP-4-amino-4,6-dideoxygalactose transaminase